MRNEEGEKGRCLDWALSLLWWDGRMVWRRGVDRGKWTLGSERREKWEVRRSERGSGAKG